MKIIRNLFLIFLALALIFNGNRENSDRLAEASEIISHSCDHSACEREIDLLEAELEEARRSCILSLRIEIEVMPGLLGEWARLEFHSAPIEISAEAAEDLCIGQDLCLGAEGEWNIIACRIIVEDLVHSI